MPRPDKVAKVEEVKSDLANAAATLLMHYRGLSVKEMAQLRAKLRTTHAELRISKNTLTRRAAVEAGMDDLVEFLVGPTGLVFCEQDPVGPSKVLKEFAREHPGLVVRGGFLDGEVLDETAAVGLAELASREELLTRLAGLMYGALASTARLLQAPIEQQARLMQALVDAGGAPGAPTDEPTPTAEAESADADASEEPAADAPEASEEPAVDGPEASDAPAADAPEASDAPAVDTPDASEMPEGAAPDGDDSPPATDTDD